jgi:hypothetical protein
MERKAEPFSKFQSFKQQSDELERANLGPASSPVVPDNTATAHRFFDSSADKRQTQVTVFVCPRKSINAEPVFAHHT